MNFTERYGKTALIAGASEGIGAAFARSLAQKGMNLILVARRKDPLEQTVASIEKEYGVIVRCIVCDLADEDATDRIRNETGNTEVDVLICNAANSPIGPYLELSESSLMRTATVNMLTPMKMARHFGGFMVNRKRGAVILMASLAGFQGTPYIAAYSAAKAFNRMLGESLWYEWRTKGVDVIACCAGATETPGYIQSKPKSAGWLAPRIQKPEEVVTECLMKLGQVPSFIAGRGNRVASFFMHKVLSRKASVTNMGDTIRKMYSIHG